MISQDWIPLIPQARINGSMIPAEGNNSPNETRRVEARWDARTIRQSDRQTDMDTFPSKTLIIRLRATGQTPVMPCVLHACMHILHNIWGWGLRVGSEESERKRAREGHSAEYVQYNVHFPFFFSSIQLDSIIRTWSKNEQPIRCSQRMGGWMDGWMMDLASRPGALHCSITLRCTGGRVLPWKKDAYSLSSLAGSCHASCHGWLLLPTYLINSPPHSPDSWSASGCSVPFTCMPGSEFWILEPGTWILEPGFRTRFDRKVPVGWLPEATGPAFLFRVVRDNLNLGFRPRGPRRQAGRQAGQLAGRQSRARRAKQSEAKTVPLLHSLVYVPTCYC